MPNDDFYVGTVGTVGTGGRGEASMGRLAPPDRFKRRRFLVKVPPVSGTVPPNPHNSSSWNLKFGTLRDLGTFWQNPEGCVGGSRFRGLFVGFEHQFLVNSVLFP